MSTEKKLINELTPLSFRQEHDFNELEMELKYPPHRENDKPMKHMFHTLTEKLQNNPLNSTFTLKDKFNKLAGALGFVFKPRPYGIDATKWTGAEQKTPAQVLQSLGQTISGAVSKIGQAINQFAPIDMPQQMEFVVTSAVNAVDQEAAMLANDREMAEYLKAPRLQTALDIANVTGKVAYVIKGHVANATHFDGQKINTPEMTLEMTVKLNDLSDRPIYAGDTINIDWKRDKAAIHGITGRDLTANTLTDKDVKFASNATASKERLVATFKSFAGMFYSLKAEGKIPAEAQPELFGTLQERKATRDKMMRFGPKLQMS